MDDFNTAISYFESALSLRPVGHAHRPESLVVLANALTSRYLRYCNVDDLETSMKLHQEAIDLWPKGYPLRPGFLTSFANALIVSYKNRGNTEHLERAIVLFREALSLRSKTHPDWPSCAMNLGSALRGRYDLLGKLEDLEEGLSIYREAESFCFPGHPNHFAMIINLAPTLWDRFLQFGEAKDLDDCISAYREIFNVLPLLHANPPIILVNLANSIMTKYEQFHDPKDLDEAIDLFRKGCHSFPAPHPNHHMFLNNIANALLKRYQQYGNVEELEECISLLRQLLSLLPRSHPAHYVSLQNLATALTNRYQRYQEEEDLNQSIESQRSALFLRPYNRSLPLVDLASSLLSHYEKFGDTADIREAFQLCELGGNDATSPIQDRLEVAIQWIKEARRHQHTSMLSAYKTSLVILARHFPLLPSTVQQKILTAVDMTLDSLASDAAAAALDAGNIGLAVEFLEQGKALLWSTFDAKKSPLEELRQIDDGPRLADRLETISGEIERLIVKSIMTIDEPSKERPYPEAFSSVELLDQAANYSKEWDDIVGRIRQFEGFHHFLQIPPFEALQSAAAEGPVILVNISDYRSDAIIVLQDRSPALVNLPEVRLDELRAQTQVGTEGETTARLRYLWDNIVSPIVECLIELKIPMKSRIWWCPTGELTSLPLHAARGDEKDLQDLYTSFYTPTLLSLIKSRSDVARPFSGVPRPVVEEPSVDPQPKELKDDIKIIEALRADNPASVPFCSEGKESPYLSGIGFCSYVSA